MPQNNYISDSSETPVNKGTMNIKGYITNLSPIKTSKAGKPYFHGLIQTSKSEVAKIVDFRPYKQKELKVLQTNDTAVEMIGVKHEVTE